MNSPHYALVTGASSGIGKAIATELANRKINLLLVALPDKALEKCAEEFRKINNIKVHTLPVDLTKENSPEQILVWCQQNQFSVNILINNAGFGNLCSFQSTKPDIFRDMMILNNQALICLTHLFIPELKKNREGYIMNLGSMASFFSLPNKSIYSATKSFVFAFSSSLRLELKPENIHVSCLCPGNTLTSERVKANVEGINYSGTFFTQHAEEVAQEAVRKMFNKKFKIITGWPNRMLYTFSILLPNKLINYLMINIFGKKKKKNVSPLIPEVETFSMSGR